MYITYNAIEHKILVSLFGEELGSPPANISHGLCRPFLRANSRNSEQHFGFLTYSIEEFCRCEVGNIVCDFELTPSTHGRGVDHSLRNTLPAEMGKSLDELSILQQEQTLHGAVTNTLGGVGVSYRAACSAC